MYVTNILNAWTTDTKRAQSINMNLSTNEFPSISLQVSFYSYWLIANLKEIVLHFRVDTGHHFLF